MPASSSTSRTTEHWWTQRLGKTQEPVFGQKCYQTKNWNSIQFPKGIHNKFVTLYCWFKQWQFSSAASGGESIFNLILIKTSTISSWYSSSCFSTQRTEVRAETGGKLRHHEQTHLGADADHIREWCTLLELAYALTNNTGRLCLCFTTKRSSVWTFKKTTNASKSREQKTRFKLTDLGSALMHGNVIAHWSEQRSLSPPSTHKLVTLASELRPKRLDTHPAFPEPRRWLQLERCANKLDR